MKTRPLDVLDWSEWHKSHESVPCCIIFFHGGIPWEHFQEIPEQHGVLKSFCFVYAGQLHKKHPPGKEEVAVTAEEAPGGGQGLEAAMTMSRWREGCRKRRTEAWHWAWRSVLKRQMRPTCG